MRRRELFTYSDGGARGNPGPAAIGVVIKTPSGEVVKAFGRLIGEATNNVAEYSALIAALEVAKAHNAVVVHCHLDSELIVRQLKREYRVKNRELQSLFLKAWNLAAGFKKITFTHVPREANREADALVNSALDEALALAPRQTVW